MLQPKVVSKVQPSKELENPSGSPLIYLFASDKEIAFVSRNRPVLFNLERFAQINFGACSHILTGAITCSPKGVYVQAFDTSISYWSLDDKSSRKVFYQERMSLGKLIWDQKTDSLFSQGKTGIHIFDQEGRSKRVIKTSPLGYGLAICDNLIYATSDAHNANYVYSFEGKLVNQWKTQTETVFDLCIYKQKVVILGKRLVVTNLEGKLLSDCRIPDIDTKSCASNSNILFTGGREILCWK